MASLENQEKEATRVEYYMALPYRMEVYWDEDYWAAEFPELPGLVAGSDAWDRLQEKIEDAKRAWFESALEHDDPIPEPRAGNAFSGKLVLRMPKSLHAQAARTADREGVSLNTLILTALSKELSHEGTGQGPQRPIAPPLRLTFDEVHRAISGQHSERTPELKTTGGVPFIAEARVAKDGRRYISLPHSNRIYEEDWGYATNSMGKDGQRIGQYAAPLDEWAQAQNR